ncbi:MAG: hypothetical protein AB7N90_16005, partial [Vicinamibacterales bacterium]
MQIAEPNEPVEPDEPDEPDEPVEPDEPDEPVEPDEPDDMFAALHAPPEHLAGLIDVAQGFTPRFEVLPPVVLLDVSGLSRLFGSAEEIGRCLLAEINAKVPEVPRVPTVPEERGQVPKVPKVPEVPGVRSSSVSSVPSVASSSVHLCSVSVASVASVAVMFALARRGLTVVPRGEEAAALAPLPVGLLDRFEAVREGRAGEAEGRPAAGAPAAGGWRHPRDQRPGATQLATVLGTAATPGRRPDARARQAARAAGTRVDVLRRWGIRTLEALAGLPPAELSARLGQAGVYWQRLARGGDDRPLVPWGPEP